MPDILPAESPAPALHELLPMGVRTKSNTLCQPPFARRSEQYRTTSCPHGVDLHEISVALDITADDCNAVWKITQEYFPGC